MSFLSQTDFKRVAEKVRAYQQNGPKADIWSVAPESVETHQDWLSSRAKEFNDNYGEALRAILSGESHHRTVQDKDGIVTNAAIKAGEADRANFEMDADFVKSFIGAVYNKQPLSLDEVVEFEESGLLISRGANLVEVFKTKHDGISTINSIGRCLSDPEVLLSHRFVSLRDMGRDVVNMAASMRACLEKSAPTLP